MPAAQLLVLQLLFVPIAAAVSSVASFPNTEIVLDMARLSYAVYELRKEVSSCDSLLHKDTSNGTQQELPSVIFNRLLPNGTSCLYYNHDYSIGRQVLVVRNSEKYYLGVAYAGTDDWRTALSDGHILTEAFGPGHPDNNANIPSGENVTSIFDSVPSEVRVHSGFNNDVFANAGFSTVLQCVTSGMRGGTCVGNETDSIQPTQPYRIYTTGHSLGAASSVILGAALHLAYPRISIQSVNFGCPKIGNIDWSAWIDTMQPNYKSSDTASGSAGTFEVFRFVNKIDLVPRLPDSVYFQHAGHTLQMSTGGIVKAYFDHVGDEDLGFAGVPYGWGAAPYVFLPAAIAAHRCTHYLDYLQSYQPPVQFELVDNSTISDYENNALDLDYEAYSIE